MNVYFYYYTLILLNVSIFFKLPLRRIAVFQIKELAVSLHSVLNIFFLVNVKKRQCHTWIVDEVLEKLILLTWVLEVGRWVFLKVLEYCLMFEALGCILGYTDRWLVFAEYLGPAIEE